MEKMMNNQLWQLTPIEHYANFWQEWQGVYQKNHNRNAMLSADFLSLLVSYFPAKLHVLSVKNENQVVMLMLLEKVNMISWKTYSPGQLRVAPIVADPGFHFDEAELFKVLGNNTLKLDIFALDPNEHQGLINQLPTAHRVLYAKNIDTNISGTFEEYWQQRSKTLRKKIKRYSNQIINDGLETSLKVFKVPEQVTQAVRHYGLLESKGWKGEMGTAIHPDNTQGKFYNDLLLGYANKQQAKVYELWIADTLVASRLLIGTDNSYIILKTTYDESFKQYNVGWILLHQMFEHMFEQKHNIVVDFYTSASSEQLKWSTSNRDMISITLYKNKFIDGSFAVLRRLKSKLKG